MVPNNRERTADADGCVMAKKHSAASLLEPEARALIDAECVDVDTGAVKVTALPVVLRSIALGSCVAVVMHDPVVRVSGLAHVMLPGRAFRNDGYDSTRYAQDAIETLVDGVVSLGGLLSRLEVCLVGGANILGEGDIPDRVVESVRECLLQSGISVRGCRVGGCMRRSVFVNNTTGTVLYSEGDSPVQLLDGSFERAIQCPASTAAPGDTVSDGVAPDGARSE
jgi:chemotaxis protein CheD